MTSQNHPYKHLSPDQYWSTGMAELAPGLLCPARPHKTKLKSLDRVATLGSCFAQHIGHHLVSHGFNFYQTEAAPDWMAKDYAREQGYGMFSARYGNVYTPRQAVQLFTRAFGQFIPVEHTWPSTTDSSRVIDPFRPGVQAGGYPSADAMIKDQAHHFHAVRGLFQSTHWFVLTLGLTEAWQDLRDGAIFPIAPGVLGGKFDASCHRFVNFTVEECIKDLILFQKLIALVNPTAQIILTVSPVALSATYEPKHVWQATTYSKSVLRVAAETLSRQCDNVSYFPAYEIITSPLSGNCYLENDMRQVNTRGVDHVMRAFFKTYVDETDSSRKPLTTLADDMQIQCDESQLDKKNLRTTLIKALPDFDERTYLDANPDVAIALSQGLFESARQHYQLYGQFEGRNLVSTAITSSIEGLGT